MEADKIDLHKVLCDEIHNLYVAKNRAYGDSFSETYNKLGIISAVTRISDKYNRLISLAINPDIDDLGERLEDTLIDLANYSLMTVMELKQRTTYVRKEMDINDLGRL